MDSRFIQVGRLEIGITSLFRWLVPSFRFQLPQFRPRLGFRYLPECREAGFRADEEMEVHGGASSSEYPLAFDTVPDVFVEPHGEYRMN